MSELDGELLSLAREGRLVLFLGAGASKGSKNKTGGLIPDGQQLAKLLAQKFLSSKYENTDLKTVYDLSCSNRSIREVQRYLYEIFEGFDPTNAHCLIPQ